MNTCNIIRDLLPLYEDREVSAETAEIIKAHLNTCAECRDYARRIKHVTRAMQDQNSWNNYHYSEVVKRIHKNSLAQQVAGAVLLAAACYGLFKLAAAIFPFGCRENQSSMHH